MRFAVTTVSALAFAAGIAAAQSTGIADVIAGEDVGPAVAAVDTSDAPPPYEDPAEAYDREDGMVRALRLSTLDGSLSADDVDRLREEAGPRVNDREMLILREALSGLLEGQPAFEVEPEARERGVEVASEANLSEESAEYLRGGVSFGGTPIPASVREVVARARLNGAVAYDVTEVDEDDGEGVYTDYPSITPATENMTFRYTEVTPAALERDMADTRPHLRKAGTDSVDVNGDRITVARYAVGEGGTGSISAAYDEALHPVSDFSPFFLSMLEYPAWLAEDWTIDHVRTARTRSGNKWSSNCVIMSDGAFHCLPAIRRHSATRGLILTNPALARGELLLWNGHIRVERGVVTYIGTSGRIAKRAARGDDRFINPIPLLKAWGFELRPGLEVVSEHREETPAVSESAAVLYESDSAEP